MIIDDEEEKKRRLQEAMDITNRINTNSYNFNDYQSTSDINDSYNQKLQEAREITNSINPITYENNTFSNIEESSEQNISTSKKDVENEEQEENKKKIEIFKKSKAFDDGYQIGDITDTVFGTATDAVTNAGAGSGSVFESLIDIGAHAVATIQSLFGDEEASKKTREWADKDILKEGLKSNSYSSPIGAFYNFSKGNGTYWDNLQRQQIQNIREKQNNGEELSSFEKTQLTMFGNIYPETENKYPANYEDDSILGETSDQVVELMGYTAGLAAGTALLGGAGNIPISIGSKTLNLPTLAITGGMAGGLKEADSKGENVSEIERWTKAISGGLIEGTTEGIFGMFGVGGNELTDIFASKVASKMSTGAGKILAKLGVQSSGEAIEEFLSYAGNYIVDNGIINRLGDTDFSKEWDWGEVGEQMALAFVSSAISLGGESYINTNQSIKAAENQLGRKLTSKEKVSVIKAITEDALIKYDNKELFEDGEESVGNYFVASYNENGEVSEVVETLGKSIDNPNAKLNIEPVIIKEQQNKTFNIIDGKTGIILDTTPYSSVQEAEKGFTEIITNISDTQIESINKNVSDSTLSLYAEIGKIIQEKQTQDITSQNQQNDTTDQNNIQGQEINNQNNKIAQNGFSEQINNNQNQTENKSFEDVVSDAMLDTETNEVESPIQNRNIETIGKQINVNAYQYDNPEVKPYFQEMAQMMGEDLSYISSQENRSSLKGGGTKLNTTTKAITTLHDEMGYSYNDIAKGLQNIIEDNGKENNAISKKLELVIDEQLRNGYTNALGKAVAPNQEYINTINVQENIEETDGKHTKNTTSTHERMFTAEIDKFKNLSKSKNVIKNNILEININVLEGITKKKQRSFMNEYLRDEVQGKDFFKGTEKIIATGTTTGKLSKGKTNFDKRIDNSLRFEIKSNIIANMDKIIEISEITQGDRIDTKNHTFAETFDRRNSLFTYKGKKMEVMFETGKKNNISTLYGIENIKITNKNRLSLPKLATQSGLQDTQKGMRVS